MTRVVFQSNIRGFERELKRGLERSLLEAGEALAAATRARAPVGDGTSGIEPGHMRDTIQASPVVKGRRSTLVVNVYSGDPTSRWLELGTLGRRRKKLKQDPTRSNRRQLSRSKGSGIRPRRFFSAAARAVFPGAIARTSVAVASAARRSALR